MKHRFQTGGLILFVILLSVLSGCYERKVAPTYSSQDSEVKRIREHLGAITPDEEYSKEEEEEEEEEE